MSKNVTLDEIKKFWPEKAPNINIVQKYVSKYEKERIVIKYGGNVLIDRNVFNNFFFIKFSLNSWPTSMYHYY